MQYSEIWHSVEKLCTFSSTAFISTDLAAICTYKKSVGPHAVTTKERHGWGCKHSEALWVGRATQFRGLDF